MCCVVSYRRVLCCRQVGDFGLAREVNAGRSTSTLLTSTVLGTSAYMPPEAFRGDVSVKLDTFSFGIVSSMTGILGVWTSG